MLLKIIKMFSGLHMLRLVCCIFYDNLVSINIYYVKNSNVYKHENELPRDDDHRDTRNSFVHT